MSLTIKILITVLLFSVVGFLFVHFFYQEKGGQDKGVSQMVDMPAGMPINATAAGRPIEPQPAGTPLPYTPMPTMIPEKMQ